MTEAIAAFGTLLKMGAGTGGTAEVFSTIAEVGDIDGPSNSVDTIDVTNHSSPGARKEFIASLIDSGEISFSVNLITDDPTHDDTTGLQKVENDRTRRNFHMIFPDSSQVAFMAMVTKFGIKGPVAGKLSADVTLKISGPLTWT
jgi:predicted secreted protein